MTSPLRANADVSSVVGPLGVRLRHPPQADHASPCQCRTPLAYFSVDSAQAGSRSPAQVGLARPGARHFSRDCRPECRPRCPRRRASTPQSRSIGRGCPARRSPVPCCAATTGCQRGTHMNKAELAARVATSTSLSRMDVHAAVNAWFSAIADALAAGDTDTVAGFGTPAPARRSLSRPRTRRSSRPEEPCAMPSPSGFELEPYLSRTPASFSCPGARQPRRAHRSSGHTPRYTSHPIAPATSIETRQAFL